MSGAGQPAEEAPAIANDVSVDDAVALYAYQAAQVHRHRLAGDGAGDLREVARQRAGLPRMKADANSPPNQIVFRFAGGTNLNPAKDRHMHEATLTIVGNDRIEVSGVGWENGAPAKEMCCGLKLVRKN